MPFCPNCGKALQEKEKCTCTATTATENKTPETQEAQPKKKGKKPVILVALIAIVVIAAVALVLVLTNKPHMKPINDFVSAINKQETGYVELYETLMPDFAAKKMAKVFKALAKNEDFAERLESSSRSMEYNYQNLTDAFGSWKLKFEVRNEELLDGEELTNVQNRLKKYYENNLAYEAASYETTLNDKELLEDYADDKDITKKEAKAFLQAAIDYYEAYRSVEVGDVYEVKGRFILKAKGEKYDTDSVKFYLANVNGDWFLYSFREGELEFDSDVHSYVYFIRNYLTSGKYFISVTY